MSDANTWYHGTAIDVSGYTYYYDSWYKAAAYFSVIDNTDGSYKIRLHGSVYFNEWSGWTSSSLNVDGTAKVTNSPIYSPVSSYVSAGYATNGPWTKDITISKSKTSQSKTYSITTYCGGGGWSSVSLTISVPALTSYTISFNANNGTGAPANQTKYYGIDLTLSSTIPVRSGYKFLGWSDSSTATTPSYMAGGTYSGNANATLYAVWEAQASPITSVTDVVLTSSGATCTVKWTPLISTFKFKLKFTVGAYEWITSDYIVPGNTNEYTFVSPGIFNYSIANYITSGTTLTATCSLATYNSSNEQMGATQTALFTVTVPPEIVPVINSITFTEGTQAGFNGRFTKGLSTVKTTVNTEGVYGSTIQSVSVKLLDSTYIANETEGVYVATSDVLMTYGTLNVEIQVTDSRNAVTVETRTISVYDYFIPYGSFTITIIGTTITVRVVGNVASVDNQNTKTLTITRTKISDSSTQTVTFTPSQYSFTQDWAQTLADAQLETYSYKVVLTDKKGNKYEETQITAITVISRLRGGKGVTLFKEAEYEGFWIKDVQHDITSDEYLEFANMLAKNYDVSSSYYVGEFTIYNSKVWENNTAIIGGEAWNASHWTELGSAT